MPTHDRTPDRPLTVVKKYLYMLFSPDTLMPLDEWVFNTEAHPLRIWNDKSIDHLFSVFGNPGPAADQQPIAQPGGK